MLDFYSLKSQDIIMATDCTGVYLDIGIVIKIRKDKITCKWGRNYREALISDYTADIYLEDSNIFKKANYLATKLWETIKE